MDRYSASDVPEPRDSGADRALAMHLQQRRWQERITEAEAAWMSLWEETHHAEPGWDEPLCTSNQHDSDLGQVVRGVHVLGACGIEELGNGNANVAGGWYVQVESVASANGWYRGFTSRLIGFEAFCDAFGVDPPDGCIGTLGPFYDAADPSGDRQNAYEALSLRLLTTLIHVSRIVLTAHPTADATAMRQEHEFKKQQARLRARQESASSQALDQTGSLKPRTFLSSPGQLATSPSTVEVAANSVNFESTGREIEGRSVVSPEFEVRGLGTDEIVVLAEVDSGEQDWTVELLAARNDGTQTTSLILDVDTALELARALIDQSNRARRASIRRRADSESVAAKPPS